MNNYEETYERRLGQPRTEQERLQQHYQRYGTYDLPRRGTRIMARGLARAQVSGVPDQYLDMLQSIHFNKGVPISWLAAVCEMTGWDEDFLEMNYDRVPNSVRRFGIAGIWASIPEIIFPDDQVFNCTLWSQVPAGWVPAVYWVQTQLWQGKACYCPPCPQDAQRRTSVEDNLNLAADILKNCGEWVERICGSYNELIFLRWQLGCSYVPEFDYDLGACIIPPGLPDLFKQEMDAIVAAQAIYAEEFGETPVVPPGSPGPPGPPGEPGISPAIPLLALAGLLGVFGIMGMQKKKGKV